MSIIRTFHTGKITLLFTLLSATLVTSTASADPSSAQPSNLAEIQVQASTKAGSPWLARSLSGIDAAYVNMKQLPGVVGSLVQTGLDPVVDGVVLVSAKLLQGTTKSAEALSLKKTSTDSPFTLKSASNWSIEPQVHSLQTVAVAPSQGEEKESYSHYVGLGVEYRF
jgi:hypothetical protein